MLGVAKEMQASFHFRSHSACSSRLTLERSCEDHTGNSTAHLNQDAESSVVSFDTDGGNVGCRDGPVSEVLAAQHEDALGSSQVQL